MADVAEGLTIDRDRMRRNMDAVGEPMRTSAGAADTLRRELLDTD
jgi:hypothetical protein